MYFIEFLNILHRHLAFRILNYILKCDSFLTSNYSKLMIASHMLLNKSKNVAVYMYKLNRMCVCVYIYIYIYIYKVNKTFVPIIACNCAYIYKFIT